ncbi:zf-HC2 domain-containing protein [Nonomuraea sp. NPDC049725]|uniref:anti-sigma factor family protein n=1 Tax=Nonomuraea sp. NPDC049725 TaxID=3154508 RepID=UPI00342CA12B
MTCEEVRLSLGAHALGALEPDEAEELDTHLATCEACGAELLDLEGVAGFLGKVSERDVELVASPPRAVLDRLLDDRARRHRRGRRLTVVAAAAAALVVGGTVWGVTQQGGATEQAASAPAARSTVNQPLTSEEAADQAMPLPSTGRPERAMPLPSSTGSDQAEPLPSSSGRTKATPSARESEAPSLFMESAEEREFAGARQGRDVTVRAQPAEDGAELHVVVTGLPPDAEGRIVVRGRDGGRDTAGSWTGSAPQFSVRTRIPLAEIARVDVVGVKGDLYVSAVPRN